MTEATERWEYKVFQVELFHDEQCVILTDRLNSEARARWEVLTVVRDQAGKDDRLWVKVFMKRRTSMNAI